jgi:hypothetical protein
MTSSSSTTYPDWKAPREDGEILVSPEPSQILSDSLDNQKRLASSDLRVQNVALRELRTMARQWFGHNDAQPLIGDGHQTELHHPGVWAKRVVTHLAASRLSASSAHFAIDTDAPKHLILRWIGGSAPITDDPHLSDAHLTALLNAPTPAHVDSILAAIPRDADLTREFLLSLRRLALEAPKLAPTLTNAIHELDWSLGLRHHVYLASPIWTSEPFLILAHHLIARACSFARSYNAALAAYRREKRVRTPTRPMPDLTCTDDAVELPFWLDNLATGARTRPSAFARDGGGFVISVPSGEEFDFDPNADAHEAAMRLATWLRQNHLRLSPRALTLMLFLRLLVVDQFVHGIGGGQYDQVTDRIIADYFKLTPPKFSVATATLYLPQAVDRSRACVNCVLQEGHRLKHSLLGERKRELVEQIAAAPRHSSERYSAFASMHRELSAAAVNHPKLAEWEQRLNDTRVRESEESAIFDRELFYALQPRDRLESMIARFANAFASA